MLQMHFLQGAGEKYFIGFGAIWSLPQLLMSTLGVKAAVDGRAMENGGQVPTVAKCQLNFS